MWVGCGFESRGRQLDAGIPTIEALLGIVRALDDDTTVLLDGGIRRGTDVVVALAGLGIPGNSSGVSWNKQPIDLSKWS